MNWLDIILSVGGSGLVIGIIEWVRFRNKDKADATLIAADADGKTTDNALRYAEHLEERMEKMEERQGRMETSMTIYQKAINCGYRCKHVENPEEECPVIVHLNESAK